MKERRRHQATMERMRGPLVDRNPCVGFLGDGEGVSGALVYKDVSCNGGDAGDVELGRAERQEDGEGVVNAGVDVEDDSQSLDGRGDILWQRRRAGRRGEPRAEDADGSVKRTIARRPRG